MKKAKLTRREVYEKTNDYDINMEYVKDCDVQSGSWILITRNVSPTSPWSPVVYGIYWGVPHDDPFSRQCCKIHTTEDVVLLNHEYKVIDEAKVERYRSMGWELHETGHVTHALNMQIIEQGRALVEEEREIIWALQLDGLSEEQSCEEYFLSKHTDYNNYTICYLPKQEIYWDLVGAFGNR